MWSLGLRLPYSALLLRLLLALLPPPSLPSPGLRSSREPDLDLRSFQAHEGWDPGHNWHKRNAAKKCKSFSDIYFVLDKSESAAKWWNDIQRFAVNMEAKLTSPKQRLSLITFSCKGNIILPLTSDRAEIRKGLERLKYSIPVGGESVDIGLYKAIVQMKEANKGAAQVSSLIICVLSKTLEKDFYKIVKARADETRNLGASVYAVGVGTPNRAQLIGIADKEEYVFSGVQYDYLGVVPDLLMNKICPSISSLDKDIVCANKPYNIGVHGYHFNSARNRDKVICRFKFSDNTVKDTKPIRVSQNFMTCPGPIIDLPEQKVFVEVSLDGNTSLANNLWFTTVDCTISDPPSATRPPQTPPLPEIPPGTSFLEEPVASSGMFFLVPLLLALLLALLLLGCLRQLCRPQPISELPSPLAKSEMAPKEEKLPPPPPPPPPPAVPPPPAPPPVTVCPVVIICCCACRGVCVNRGSEGSCTNLDVLKALCSQAPCDLTTSFQPSQESLPLANCWQCHHPKAGAPSLPSGRCCCSLACPAQPVEPHCLCHPTSWPLRPPVRGHD